MTARTKNLVDLFSSTSDANYVVDDCRKCRNQVYPADNFFRVNGSVFHKRCFMCSVCKRQLNLRSYHLNQKLLKDREIYCSLHCPKVPFAHLDSSALGIRAALDAPELGVQGGQIVRGAGHRPSVGLDAMHIQFSILAQRNKATKQGSRPTPKPRSSLESAGVHGKKMDADDIVERSESMGFPPPHPPSRRKRDLYTDEAVFLELDEHVAMVTSMNLGTFEELAEMLMVYCNHDLEKARAIYVWIASIDLSKIDFDVGDDLPDGPIKTLHEIKIGENFYHKLFTRLCSCAGLPCVEIGGYSKSRGYEPGMKIFDDRFQNDWNAVLILGDWWPVQCNWGSRYFARNKDFNKSYQEDDDIKYNFDSHYFLTDPDEFVHEFLAHDPDWQLLDYPLSLDEFETLPLVKSNFFEYGLQFDPHDLQAVQHADEIGRMELKILIPEEQFDRFIFDYRIRFVESDDDVYNSRCVNPRHLPGSDDPTLQRFVFLELLPDECSVVFSVQAPFPGSYFLEIFVGNITDQCGSTSQSDPLGSPSNQPATVSLQMKSCCKFRIVCSELAAGSPARPFPNCAAGEWGPSKARRHFGMKPLTHKQAVIYSERGDVVIQFALECPLEIRCKLLSNKVEERSLNDFVQLDFMRDGSILVLHVSLPFHGQFGIDIFARRKNPSKREEKFLHVCKYLLVCGND